MNIAKTLLFIATVASSMAAGAQGRVYLEENFDNGMPSSFTLVDADENPVVATNYKNAAISTSWSANLVDTRSNQAACSFSSSQYDYAVENWMITPAMTIESDKATLRWDARSLHYDLRESYKVMVSTATADIYDFQELCRVDGEDYTWHTRTVSLADYEGQTIYIAFVATSTNKFILAIDNLLVGELTDHKFTTRDATRRFVGASSATALVEGTIANVGAAINLDAIECVSDEGTATQQESRLWATGDTIHYAFDIAVSLGHVAHYALRATTTDGIDPIEILSDSIFCSHFPKTLLAEEGTGTWCNNCPVGTLQGNDMKERFGDEVLVIANHTRDRLTCTDYNAGLSRWVSGIPAYIFNRDNSTLTVGTVLDRTRYNLALSMEVPAMVEMALERTEDNPSLLTISTRTQFATAYDNADGRYKLGYAIIEKTIEGSDSTVQANNCTLVTNGEYYYMPYNMPPALTFFHNVPREGSTAFSGVAGSLPVAIEAGGTYDYTHTMTLAADLMDKDDLFVVVYVINTLTGKVLNVAQADIPAIATGIAEVTTSGTSAIGIAYDGGAFSIDLPSSSEPFAVTVCGLDGTVLRTATGHAATGELTIACPEAKGRCCIVRVAQGSDVSVRKLFIE